MNVAGRALPTEQENNVLAFLARCAEEDEAPDLLAIMQGTCGDAKVAECKEFVDTMVAKGWVLKTDMYPPTFTITLAGTQVTRSVPEHV